MRNKRLKFLALALLAAGGLPQSASAQDKQTVTYQYDALGRLVKVSHVAGANKGTVTTHDSDRASNRTRLKTQGARPPVIVVPVNGGAIIPLH